MSKSVEIQAEIAKIGAQLGIIQGEAEVEKEKLGREITVLRETISKVLDEIKTLAKLAIRIRIMKRMI